MTRAPRLAALTGGTGFVGRAVACRLAASGWHLRLLTRGHPIHPQLAGIPFEAVPGEITDSVSVERLVASADLVVHCAGLTKASGRAEFDRVNRRGSAVVAQAVSRLAPSARVVAISSLAARAPHVSNYAASKAAGEAELHRALISSGRLLILRPAAVYGPWDKDTLEIFRLVARGFAPLLNRPDARVSLVHVDDLAQAVVAAADCDVGPGIYEVADASEGYSWAELMTALEIALSVRRTTRISVPRAALLALAGASELGGRFFTSSGAFTLDRARQILHPDWRCSPDQCLPGAVWRACIPLQAGLADTAAWYRESGWL